MPYVNVPNDLSKIKTKIAFNLTKRQLVCFGIGAAVGIPAYLLLGKDGKRAYDNLSEGGYPGSQILQNNIEVALTK